MAFSETLKNAVNDYCNNHLADESWYNEEFEFDVFITIKFLLLYLSFDDINSFIIFIKFLKKSFILHYKINLFSFLLI